MNTVQIIGLIIGALLIVPSSVWTSLFTSKGQSKPEAPKDKVELSKPVNTILELKGTVESTDKLVHLVADWEEFRRRSLDLNLTDVVTKMDEVFPLLLKVVQDERKS